jgi:PAS domain S-box-containing protein
MKPLSRIQEVLADLPVGSIPEHQMHLILKELGRARVEYDHLQAKYDRAIQGKAVVHSLLQKSSEEMIERYRALFEYSGTPMVILNKEGIITRANSHFISYTGIPYEELVNRTSFFELIAPPDREMAERYHKARRRFEKVPSQYEIRIIARFPASRDVSLSVGLMPGGEESLVSLNDITEKKKQGSELAAHNKQLETLLNLYQMTDDAESVITAYVIKKAVELTRSSNGFLAFTGSDPNIVTIESFWSEKGSHEENNSIPWLKQMNIPIDDLPYLRQVIHTGEALILDSNSGDSRVLTSAVHDPVYYQRALIIPVIEQEKTVVIACVADKEENYDVSDQMQLTVLTAGMWRLITRNRQEEALKTANKKLGLLSSLTRHDIINLLTALEGYIDLSCDSTNDTQLLSLISREREIVRSIGEIIAFTREYEMVGINTPIWQDIQNVFNEAVMESSGEGLAVTSRVKGVWIYADPLLVRVFSNFIDNSRRHGERVTMISLTWERKGDALVLVYQDNGIGIPAGEKEKVFIRGYGKHTGLGLFLIREIFAITGIGIRETGEPGAGVRFEMNVPSGNFRILGDPTNRSSDKQGISDGGELS